ncbi:MAG: hypothetical protein ACO1OB_31450 [Archangium sp.]
MLVVETHGLAGSSLDSLLPPQAHVWDCFNSAQTYAAAFEVNEAAIRAGFMPDEATTLSLALAELASRAVTQARGGVASVFFSSDGWRLEVCDAGPPLGAPPNLTVAHQLSSLRVHRRPTGGSLVVAQYTRRASA